MTVGVAVVPFDHDWSGEDATIYSRLKSVFPEQPIVSMAFLFGSQAKGKTGPESDVDIAVYLEPGYTLQGVYELWNALEDMLRKKVDLLLLNDAPPLLAWSALKGKRLFIREHDFYVRYMLDVSREAEDFQEYVLDWWRWRMKIKGAV